MNELQEIAERVRIGKEALRVLKSARNQVADEHRRNAIDAKLRKTEKILNLCVARIAKLKKTTRL